MSRSAPVRPRPAVSVAAPPRWLPWTASALALIGFGVSVYLTLAHYDQGAVPLVCTDSGFVNCAAVTSSPESMVFGVIPVAVLGLPFFAVLLALETPRAWRSPLPIVRWARLGAVIAGIGFVAYLVYSELFTLHQLCIWCTVVHVVTFLLFILTVLGAGLAAPLDAD